MDRQTKKEIESLLHLYLSDRGHCELSEVVKFVSEGLPDSAPSVINWIRDVYKRGEIETGLIETRKFGAPQGTRIVWALGCELPGTVRDALRKDRPTQLQQCFDGASFDEQCELAMGEIKSSPTGRSMGELQQLLNIQHMSVGSWSKGYDQVERVVRRLRDEKRIEPVKRTGVRARYYPVKHSRKRTAKAPDVRSRQTQEAQSEAIAAGIWVRLEGAEFGPFGTPREAIEAVRAMRNV